MPLLSSVCAHISHQLLPFTHYPCSHPRSLHITSTPTTTIHTASPTQPAKHSEQNKNLKHTCTPKTNNPINNANGLLNTLKANPPTNPKILPALICRTAFAFKRPPVVIGVLAFFSYCAYSRCAVDERRAVGLASQRRSELEGRGVSAERVKIEAPRPRPSVRCRSGRVDGEGVVRSVRVARRAVGRRTWRGVASTLR